MKIVTIYDIRIDKNRYLVDFRIEPHEGLIHNETLEVIYPNTMKHDCFFPYMIVLSLILPIVAINNEKIIIRSDYIPEDNIIEYWNDILKRLQVKVKELVFQNLGVEKKLLRAPINNKYEQVKLGLLFGGGVESNFALNIFRDFNIELISINGKNWMNNNSESDHYKIKQKLEEKMVKERKLNFSHIHTNIRSLLIADDLVFNRYVSGLLFYFLSLPLCQQKDINILCKSDELEYPTDLSDQDYSLQPTVIPYISFSKMTLFLPVFNAFSKVVMVNELRNTPFLQYIYSCWNNSKQRWCGNCMKCRRISVFFERLGIDKKIIDMQDNIPTLLETGSCKAYSYNMDILFPCGKEKELAGQAPLIEDRSKNVSIYAETADLERQKQNLEGQNLNLLEQKQNLEGQNLNLLEQLQNIQGSRSWRLVRKYYKCRDFILPPNSLRKKLYQVYTESKK